MLKGFVVVMLFVNVARAIGAVDALMSYGREWFHYPAYCTHLVVDIAIAGFCIWLLCTWQTQTL